MWAVGKSETYYDFDVNFISRVSDVLWVELGVDVDVSFISNFISWGNLLSETFWVLLIDWYEEPINQLWALLGVLVVANAKAEKFNYFIFLFACLSYDLFSRFCLL